MRIIQLVPAISYGDAVSNDIFAIDNILKEKGFESLIYSQSIGKGIDPSLVKDFRTIKVIDGDILILHVAVASELNLWIKDQKCNRKVMIYHNITPPQFFSRYCSNSEACCREGVQQVKDLKNTFDYVIADSEYNKNDLIQMGYKCDIMVLPVVIPLEDYDAKPSEAVVEKYNDDFVNILFVGRIAPNKCQHDVISAYREYKTHFNTKSRLFIVGSSSIPKYNAELEQYVDKLNLQDVVFTGHTKFDEILAYYYMADVFLCQSEHEGFCVPLVEAMKFRIPIVAYDSSAIGETLGNSGFLLNEKNPLETAGLINRIVIDEKLRNTVINNQSERLNDFKYETIKNMLSNILNEICV